jgi:hypothetical protein
MFRPLVVLDESFANLGGRHPHNRVLRGVVSRIPSKHLMADCSLLERFG